MRISYYFWTTDLGVELGSSVLFISGALLCLPTCWLCTLVPYHPRSISLLASVSNQFHPYIFKNLKEWTSPNNKHIVETLKIKDWRKKYIIITLLFVLVVKIKYWSVNIKVILFYAAIHSLQMLDFVKADLEGLYLFYPLYS